MASSAQLRDVGEAAWSWVLAQVRDADGPWLPDSVPGTQVPPEDRDGLYAGIAGLAPVLAEIALARPWTEAEQVLVHGIVARLSASTSVEACLYDGLAGHVTALRLLAPGTERSVLDRIAGLMTPDGWVSTYDPLIEVWTDIIMGTAGTLLVALWAGDERFLAAGAEAVLRDALRSDAGWEWRMYPGCETGSPNFSHGTAGVASTLALIGHRLGRQDLVAAAVEGASHYLSVASLEGGGLIAPHTLPFAKREVEPVTYTWCHGPTGTSQLFAALALAGVHEVQGHDVADLRARCFTSVLTSGLPERLRPGFWDNDGRCCGTAGVGDALLDAWQDTGDQRLLDGALVMADALLDRVIRDDEGARWQFVEYRQEQPLLPPGTSWMQGAAGIGAFLLRLARVLEQGAQAKVVDRPDQWWAVPAPVRVG
jgi:lantibiotic modifying enzyme